MRPATIAVLLVGAALLLLGLNSGEAVRVMEQARSICLACIGIG